MIELGSVTSNSVIYYNSYYHLGFF